MLPILTDRTIQAFNWMLIHSLWQGLLISVIAGIVLMITRKSSSVIRYNSTLLLLCLFLLTAFFTLLYELNNIPAGAVTTTNALSSSYSTRIFVRQLISYFSEHSFLIVMLWFIFFVIKSVSMAGSMLYIQRARHYQIHEVSAYWKERISSLCEKLQIQRTVSLLESGYVKIPVVIGHLKPIILIPVGLIAGLPAAQVEAILLHELAHIRRNDYAVNFMQNISEAIFFFNPGLLWISSLLREERENCCDDIAIVATNSKEELIQALISFKEYSIPNPAYAVAFAGQKSTLLNRVMRIVYQENKSFNQREKGFFLAGIVVLAFVGFGLVQIKNSEPVKQHLARISKNIKAGIEELRHSENIKYEITSPATIAMQQQPKVSITKSFPAPADPKWANTWREANDKYVSVWDKAREKWSTVWDDHAKKWAKIWTETIRKKGSTAQEKADYQEMVASLLVDQKAEANELIIAQNKENYALSSEHKRELEVVRALQKDEKAKNNSISSEKVSLLTDQEKDVLHKNKFDEIIREKNKVQNEINELAVQWDKNVKQWNSYINQHPEKVETYGSIANSINAVDISRSVTNLLIKNKFSYLDPAILLAAEYLKINPKENAWYYGRIVRLCSDYTMERYELNAFSVWNARERNQQTDYYLKRFHKDEEYFKKLDALERSFKGGKKDVLADCLVSLSQICLRSNWKRAEKNDRENQQSTEVMEDEYYRNAAKGKPIITRADAGVNSTASDIVIPTIFTPDGDGVDDVLAISFNNNIKIRSFEISDKSTKSIFSTKDLSVFWDGSYEGKTVPKGDYLWTLITYDDSQKIIRKRGIVTVIK